MIFPSDLLLRKYSKKTIQIGIFYFEKGEKYEDQQEEVNEYTSDRSCSYS